MMTHKTAQFILKFNMLSPGDSVVCALSGGVDSVCLLDILSKLKDQLGFSLYAAHYNHKLRGAASDGDEAFVKSLCEDYEIPLYVGSGDVAGQAKKSGAGVEETAREMRYAFLYTAMAHFGANKLATAHNADDNLETLIMRLARGTGLRGLCGIPPVRGSIIRPILFATKADILDYANRWGLVHVEDATNTDESYTRNRIRARVLPVLRELNPNVAAAAVDMCQGLRLDEEYITNAARYDGDEISLAALSPRPVGVRLLTDCFSKVSGGETLSSKQLDGLFQLCQSSNPSVKLSLPGGVTAVREYDKLKFVVNEHEKEDFCVRLPENDTADVGKFLIFCKISSEIHDFSKNKNTFAIKRDMIDGALYVRSRRVGDRIALPGRPGKTLKKLFIEEKLPASQRSLVPVIADDSSVLAVYGFGADKKFIPKDGDQAVIITIVSK